MFHLHKRKFFAGIGLLAILIVGASATTQDKPKNNLKVLPKNIDHEELSKIMKGFNVSLGVKCNFCHAESKADPKKLDFASDEKKEKLSARYMLKMTEKINKKYFGNGESKEPALPVLPATMVRNILTAKLYYHHLLLKNKQATLG